jgi:putative DNA primase/helicase
LKECILKPNKTNGISKFIAVKPNSKVPVHHDWPNNPVPEEWFEEHPEYNRGVLLGEASDRLVDVDIDHPMALKLAGYFLPETELSWGRKSNPNSHRLYRTIDYSGSRQTFMYANRGMLVEYRADGCYTVFPPSIHESGEAVEFFEAGEPTELKRADLLSQVGKLASATLAALNWQQGSRHDVALALAGIFFKADWPISEAENFMRAICDGAGDKELDDRLGCIRDTYHRGQVGEAMTGWPTLAEHIGNEVAQKVAEWLGIRFTTIEPTTIAPSLQDLSHAPHGRTDLGNAERFKARNEGKCFFNNSTGRWNLWSGTHWKPTSSLEVDKLAQETAKAIFEEAAGNPELAHWAKSSCSQQKLSAMVNLAKPLMAKASSELNSNGYLLNIGNGTINLKNGEVKAHSRADMIDKIAPVRFDETATCPRFDDFISEVFAGDDELIEYVQKVLGYALTGDTREQKMFILFGDGANGKGTLTGVIASIMGDYCATAQADTIMQKSRASGSEASPDIARLVGKRLVQMSEGDTAHHLNEALIKQLSGQDIVSARELYRDLFEFKPEFKLLFSTNHLPKVRGNDNGIWRRLSPIPFSVTFSGEKLDNTLGDKLAQEKPGILNWLIQGCLEWQEKGLQEPKAVLDAKASYKSGSDNILRFLEDACEYDPDTTISKADLYQGYRDWCRDQGEHHTVKQSDFNATVLKQPQIGETRSKVARQWSGVRLVRARIETGHTIPW